MNDARMFKMHLTEYANQFGVEMDALARQTAQQLSENVIVDTPVDTGFLRSSWQPAINGVETGKGTPMAGEAATGKVMATVGIAAASMKAGDTYYFTNNAEYALYVEFGTSRMAGRFMVTDNMKKAQQVVAKIVKELKV